MSALRVRDASDARRPHRAAHRETGASSQLSEWRTKGTGSRALGAVAAGALAAGGVALGAMAIGAVAIGAVAIGRLAVGRVRIRRLEIDELSVRRLVVSDALHTPRGGVDDHDPASADKRPSLPA